jgi:hypothetical protein
MKQLDVCDPRWFPVLTVLSRLKSGPTTEDQAGLDWQPFVALLLCHLNNPVMHLRELAARALPAFTGSAQSLMLASSIAIAITPATRHNALHGALLAIRELLSEALEHDIARDDWQLCVTSIDKLGWISGPAHACPTTRGLYILIRDRFYLAKPRLSGESSVQMANAGAATLSECPSLLWRASHPLAASAPASLSSSISSSESLALAASLAPSKPDYLLHAAETLVARLAASVLPVSSFVAMLSDCLASGEYEGIALALQALHQDARALNVAATHEHAFVPLLWAVIEHPVSTGSTEAFLAAASLLLTGPFRPTSVPESVPERLWSLVTHCNSSVGEAAVSILGFAIGAIAAAARIGDWLALLETRTVPSAHSSQQLSVIHSLACAVADPSARRGLAWPAEAVRVLVLLCTYLQSEEENVRDIAALAVARLCTDAATKNATSSVAAAPPAPVSPRVALSLCLQRLEALAPLATQHCMMAFFNFLRGSDTIADLLSGPPDDALFPREPPNAFLEPRLCMHLSFISLTRLVWGHTNITLAAGDLQHVEDNCRLDDASRAVCSEISLDFGIRAADELLQALPALLHAEESVGGKPDLRAHTHGLLVTLTAAVAVWQTLEALAQGPCARDSPPPVFRAIPSLQRLLALLDAAELLPSVLSHAALMLAKACALYVPAPSELVRQYTAMTALMATSLARLADPDGASLDAQSQAALLMACLSEQEMEETLARQVAQFDAEENAPDPGEGAASAAAQEGSVMTMGDEDETEGELCMPSVFTQTWLTSLVPLVDL